MSVRKRPWITRKGEQKTAWVLDYRDQNGKRHIETFRRQKDAVAREAEVRLDIKQGTHVAPSESPTVAEAAGQWIARVKAQGREETTLQQYEQHVRTHIVPHLGRTKLAKLTPPAIEKYRDQYLLAKLSRPLARKVLTSLKSLLKAAKYSHVAADVSIGSVSRERRLEPGIDIPTTDEIKRLVAAASTPRQKALLLTAALTGLRASELRGLRWRDVDLKVGELHVRQRADRFLTIGQPKSKAASRTVPLPPELVSALKTWKLACPIGEADLVFPSSTGKVEYHVTMLHGVETVMRAAGVVERATGKPKYAMHAFRHFFASWCINPKERGGRELPPKVVQQMLGHSSIVMTLDTYSHLFPQGNDRTELAAASSALLG
jgi:integrase